MPDAFDRFQGTDSGPGDAFDRFPVPQESTLKSYARTAYQIPSGIAQAATYPADILALMGTGEALDPEFIEHLKTISEREGIPFDEEKWKEQVQEAISYFPTQGNIERGIEEKTGLPLTPKTGLQKAIKLGSTAGKLTPGAASQKAAGAVTAPAVSNVLQETGVPEQFADILGLGAAGVIGAKTSEAGIGSAKKPSGLTTRQYEKLEKPTEISSKKIKTINEKVENEFRNIASDIIEKSPIEETYSALKEDTGFKQQASESFKEVETLAQEIPEVFPSETVKKTLANEVAKKKGKGITPSEYEKSHGKFIKEFIKETPKTNISAQDLVAQYRKNNEALKQAYEPGQSFAYNRAKREAFQDYNKAIAEVIEKKFPDSEFSNLFKSTNERWSKIMDAEAIDKFMDKLFDGKIRFEKGKDFFNKNGMNLPFKRALGKEGFKNFEQLVSDLMTTEQAHKFMKAAEQKGFHDLASTGFSFLIHPKLGAVRHGVSIAKDLYRGLWEMLLDKPQMAFIWDRGVRAVKKGNFSEAEKLFDEVKKESDIFQKSEMKRVETLKKFNEKKSSQRS